MAPKVTKELLQTFAHLNPLNITSDIVRIGDGGSLSRDPDEDDMVAQILGISVTDIKLDKGIYIPSVYYDDLEGWGKRTMLFLCLRKDVHNEILNNNAHVELSKFKSISIDAGCIGLTNGIISKDYNIKDTPYVDETGVYVDSGIGDGIYPMYLLKDKDKQTVGVLCNFTDHPLLNKN